MLRWPVTKKLKREGLRFWRRVNAPERSPSLKSRAPMKIHARLQTGSLQVSSKYPLIFISWPPISQPRAAAKVFVVSPTAQGTPSVRMALVSRSTKRRKKQKTTRNVQVAEGEEDRCDQEEDKKPPTEEVIKKILFLPKNLCFRNVRIRLLLVSSPGTPPSGANAQASAAMWWAFKQGWWWWWWWCLQLSWLKFTLRNVFCGTIDENGTVTNTTEDQCDEELK